MQLLGAYESQLATWYYQGLLNLLSQAVQAGDYSGNATFDTATIQQLIAEAQSFAALPTDSAGQRVTDDYLNRPLQLLAIRYASLAQEVSSFTTTMFQIRLLMKRGGCLIPRTALLLLNQVGWLGKPRSAFPFRFSIPKP